jgi:hypothetical protein
MIARGAACRTLVRDDRLELFRRAFDDAEVVERACEHHDAGAVVQCADQLGLNVPPPLRAGDLLPQASAVIDEHVLLDRAGVRIAADVRPLTHHLDEVSQPAVILGQVARYRAGTLGHLLAPRRLRVRDTFSLETQ